MLKTKRRKELEAKEEELYFLKQKIEEVKHWCAEDSGDIAYAMLYLQSLNDFHDTIGTFRDKLRKGEYTFENYCKED